MTAVVSTPPKTARPVLHSKRPQATDLTADLLSLKDAVEYSGLSLVTLNRYIASGRLPAVKIKARNYVTQGDLDAAAGPAPIAPKDPLAVTDEGLRAWAERVAASAPPLKPEQRDIIISAFAGALLDS